MILVHDGIIDETEKATRFMFDEELVWLPNSQIEFLGDTIEVPEWLAVEKGLEDYEQ